MSTNAHNPLAVLADQASALIRDEVRAAEQRSRLEHCAAQMVQDNGYSIDEVSAVSGLTPAQIRSILSRPESLNRATLVGS